ncbi:MAG: hypothetical protein H0X27_06285 [Caulobacteraceae bacterium]|nr:hypothetical protein [Caulobacteraceae bacterium]
MAQVKYIGDEPSTTVFGHTFDKDQVLRQHTLSDDHLDRLAANPQFEVSGHKSDEPEEEPGPTLKEQQAAAKEQGAVKARLAKGKPRGEPFKSKAAGAHGADRRREPAHDPETRAVKVQGNPPHDKASHTRREADADRDGL